jgi:signal transduction histidine kinase/CheY-like chemotaxis protein
MAFATDLTNSQKLQEKEILYEIALAIGHSLDLKEMLKHSVTTIMRQLNAQTVAVLHYATVDHLQTPHTLERQDPALTWHWVYAMPKNARNSFVKENFLDTLDLPQHPSALAAWQVAAEQGGFPKCQPAGDSTLYAFYLPDFGVLILKRKNLPISQDLLLSLDVLMGKLAYSAVACLHEEALKQQIQAAQAANTAKSQFLANMSHEIRTPMNGVIGMLDITLESELTTQQREHLQSARLSAQHLLEIINLILDISKIEANKFELQPEPTDLHDFIGAVIKSQSAQASTKQLSLKYDVSPNLPRWIEADPTRLRQVLVNLIGNALKFTERGNVTVEVHPDPVAEAATEAESVVWTQITVTDTGIGIAPEHLPNIFEPFEQADSQTTRKFEGTGLGLAISRELVQMMGGTIAATSRLGQGTVFTVRLPLNPTAHPPTEATAAIIQKAHHVLIIDDEPINRSVLQNMLGLLGIPSQACASGPEGLLALRDAAAESWAFDVLLLDAHMPGIDGYAMAEQILQEGLLTHKQIRLLTSSGLASEARRCEALKLPGYLVKPVTLADLRRLFSPDHGEGAILHTPVSDSALAHSRLNVLLVEDNPINQQVAGALLKKIRALCTVAHNGQEAVERAAEEHFDMILMDVMMPVMDGIEATQHIRAHERQQQRPAVPIIALTAKAMKGDRDMYLRHGMNGYVAKPIDVDVLFAEMERLLSQRLTHTPAAESLEHRFSDLDELLGTQEISPGTGDSTPAASANQSAAAVTAPVSKAQFDWEQAVKQLGAEEDLLVACLTQFLDDLPSTEQKMRDCLTRHDAANLQMEAHTLKSLCATFCMQEARQEALALEHACKQSPNDWESLEHHFILLMNKINAITPTLQKMSA